MYGALFLLHKMKRMVILTGNRLNPTFSQEVSNLFMDLVELLFAYMVLTMILDWCIWVEQINLMFYVSFRW